MFRADLHCHSTFSDGTDTPEGLIDQAIEIGLSGLSITDHDTLAAYSRAIIHAKKRNFPLLPGIEFSAMLKKEPVHILGYGFLLESESIAHLIETHKRRREERNRLILEKLRDLSIRIDEEEIWGGRGTVGRPHIARVLVGRGLVDSIEEAFRKYLGDGKVAYVQGTPVSVEETIETIHQGGGKAVIAHPHLLKRSSVIRVLLEMPFDGIEGYYARFPLDQEKRWIHEGEKRGWVITGGSDYHGGNKPQSRLGSSWVGKDVFDALAQGNKEMKWS
ncbi:MAG: 5'-3' exoribonuclease [Chlamydiae bacterium]|nr:5'-3' exoribonuclease [Chlamydiota bacterium]